MSEEKDRFIAYLKYCFDCHLFILIVLLLIFMIIYSF